MNENITKYLSENKERHSKESLERALLNAGYQKAEVEEGMRLIYGLRGNPSSIQSSESFWDFSGRKTYKESSEKLADFCFGIFISAAAAAILSIFFPLGILFFYMANIALLVYFANRRLFITAGMAVGFFAGPMLGGLIQGILGGFGYHGYSIF